MTTGQDDKKTPKPPSMQRKLIWLGAALVALYFIVDGIIGLLK